MLLESTGAVKRAIANRGLTGQLLATGVFIVVTQLPKEALLSWGWRIPFLLSALLVLLDYICVIKSDETPVFRARLKAAGH